MTDNQIQDLKADIAFMKALAQEGQKTPLLGGAIMVAAGLIFGLASVAEWAMMTGHLDFGSPWAQLYNWGGAMVLFFIVLAIVRRRLRSQPGAGSPSNRASGTAWAAVGWTIFALAASIAVVSWRTGSNVPATLFPSIILGLYGGGWSVAAVMSRRRWLWMTAIGSYVGAVVVAWFANTPTIMLAYAVALLFLAVLPGVMLMRQEPSDTI